MDALIVIALIVWAVASVSKISKGNTRKDARRRQSMDGRPGGAEPRRPGTRPAPETRPAHMDLPGQQTSLPTAWNEGDSAMMAGQRAMERAGEGDDPCHEEMLRPAHGPGHLAAAMDEAPQPEAQQVVIPGLNLTFDGGTLLQGIVFSEILNKRAPRGAHR